MTLLLTALFLLAQAPAPTLDQVKSEANPEHRARLAVEFAAQAERNAEAAYGKAELPAVASELKAMTEAMEIAQQSLAQTGKSPRRHSGPFKSAELKSQEILRRLADLERRMDDGERSMVAGPRARVQEIHDGWFDGIMSGKK